MPYSASGGQKVSAWAITEFRWTFAALSVSTVGSQVSGLAIPLVAALTLHASPFEVGLLAGAGQLPTLLISLPVGAWVDRVRNQRQLMIGMDCVRAALLLLVPLLVVYHLLSMPVLASIVLLVGCGTVVHELAQQVLVPLVVPEDHILDANAKLQGSYSFGEAAGSGLGGLLVQTVSAPTAIVGDSISYLVSAVLLSRARIAESTSVKRGRVRPVRDIAEGLQTLLREPLLAAWTRWGAVSVIFMGGFEAQYVLFLVRDLNLEPGWIGLIATGAVIGASCAAVSLRRVNRRVGIGRSIIGGLMVYFALLGIVPAVGGAIALLVSVLSIAKILQSFAFTVSNVQQWSLRQLITNTSQLGRVSGGNRFLIGTAETLGAGLSGFGVHLLGFRGFLALCALSGFLCLTPLISSSLWLLKRLPGGR